MLKSIFSLPADLYKNRRLVMKLAKNDFKTRYAGSYFGTFWAFVQPVVTILVYWFVFSVGFRSNTDELGVPFVLYLVAGIVLHASRYTEIMLSAQILLLIFQTGAKSS